MSKLVTVSPSPHIHSGKSVSKLMYGVIIAMLPALAASIFFYGYGAIYLTLVSVASCVLFEYLIQKFILKTEVRITDGSAIVTGILLAFNLPSSLPVHIIIIGALVAIGVGKLTFGGLGNNPFNPALVGRVFLLLSFPTRMTKYAIAAKFDTPLIISTDQLDASTGATPLGLVKEGLKNGESIATVFDKNGLDYGNMFWGNIGGSIGEIAAVALIVGLAYMLIRKIITWHIPISVIGSVALFTGILWLINPGTNADPLFHILTGGLLIGAIFMATDYVTSPMVPKAQIIYGLGIGIITVLIRVYGAYPEGMSFAILIMNGFTPLLNRYVKPRRFGIIK